MLPGRDRVARFRVAVLVGTFLLPTIVPITSASAAECVSTTYSSGELRYVRVLDTSGCTWTVPSGVTQLVVVAVGGGGGGGGGVASGGNLGGGGGGAGGVVKAETITVSANSTMTINVGTGGTGGAASTTGSNGTASSVSGGTPLLSAGGGNGGGGGNNSQSCDALSGDGGSNASYTATVFTCRDTTSFPSAFFENRSNWDGAGGGSGAGGFGRNGVDIPGVGGTGGDGGAGFTNATLNRVTSQVNQLSGSTYGVLSSSNIYFAGGGGGGGTPRSTANPVANSAGNNSSGGGGGGGAGGLGGGGNGGFSINADGPTTPLANSGSGGGGGGGWQNTNYQARKAGSAGAAGIVLIEYRAAAAQAALTLNSTSGTYGTTLRLTTTGGSGTGAVTYVTGTAGCSITNTDSLTVTSALTCSVTATKAADANYTVISSAATNVIFSTRPITIKAAAKSATYTGSSVSVSNSYSITAGTLAGSDTFTALTYSYSALGYSASQTAPTNAGSYTITPSAASFSVGSASNYNITYETATLTISKASQGALTITTTTGRYGTPLRLITSGGSGTGTLSFAITSSGTASGCSITNETITVSSFGTCKVTATKALDTNYLVTTSVETTITFAKAETITVTTTLSSNSVTYNELPANVTVTQTVIGLANSDTPTVTTSYTLNSCQSGGSCVVGDLAPGGGYVFYVSATPINIATGVSTGGIYLATAPQTWYGGAADPTAGWGCNGTDITGTSEAVGSGAQNTWLNTIGCATAGRASRLAADSSAEGFTDWFMPSIGELNLIYSNLKLSNLSDLNGSYYWSSTQSASSPASSATYRAFNGGGTGTADKDSIFSVRPIRAFSPTAVAIDTLPTDAGTYLVAPTLTLSSPASLSNYQAVEYVGTTLTINKAQQSALSIGQYDAYPGISNYPLNVYGGSGPGLVTRSLISGGSAGCSITQDFFISATNVGTCDVRVEKAGTLNYFSESTTATIYWITFINRYIPAAPTTPTDLGLSGSVSIEKRSFEAFTVSSFANGSGGAVTSVPMNSIMRIIGTGFNSSDETTEVIIGFSSIQKSSLTFDTSNPAANYVQFMVPDDLDLGANDVVMRSRKGWAIASAQLTITEPVSI